MARQITLNWQADGAIDSYSVYRDTATIDTNNLPTPIATGITDKTYVDNAVDDDVVYYYVIASIAGENVEYSEVISTDEASKDPYFDNVALLLHFDGDDGSTTFTDSSNNSYQITNVNNVLVSSNNPKFGTGAGYFNGESGLDVLDIPQIPYSNDFTIETWFNINKFLGGLQVIFSQHGNSGVFSNGSISINIYNSKEIIFMRWNDSNTTESTFGFRFNSSVNLELHSWYHIALVQYGLHIFGFLNGTLIGEAIIAAAVNTNANHYISLGGDSGTNSSYFQGYLDEFRLTTGVARYTENFTPPTAPFPDA